MKKFFNDFKSKLDAVRQEEAGSVVETVLLIAVFVIIVAFAGKKLYDAITGTATSTAGCITSTGTASGMAGSGTANC